MGVTDTNLCTACRWAAAIESARGSRFLRCGRSDFDPAFPRYPRLPVRVCAGFEAREATTSSDDPPRSAILGS